MEHVVLDNQGVLLQDVIDIHRVTILPRARPFCVVFPGEGAAVGVELPQSSPQEPVALVALEGGSRLAVSVLDRHLRVIKGDLLTLSTITKLPAMIGALQPTFLGNLTLRQRYQLMGTYIEENRPSIIHNVPPNSQRVV